MSVLLHFFIEIHIFVAIKYTKINKECHETNYNSARLCRRKKVKEIVGGGG